MVRTERAGGGCGVRGRGGLGSLEIRLLEPVPLLLHSTATCTERGLETLRERIPLGHTHHSMP